MRRHWIAASLIALTILLAGCKAEDPDVAATTATTATTSTTTELKADKEGAEAQFDVTIVFLGLMTFDLTDRNAVAVYLPAVKQPVKVGEDNHEVDPHVAYLLADKTSFDTTETLVPPHGGHDVYSYLPVDGETITIPDGQIISPPFNLETSECGECPTKADAERLCWLSGMREVHGSMPAKSAQHFAPTPDKNVIAAKVPITHGTLGARVIRNKDGKAEIWKFAKPGGGSDGKPFKALAQEVHWTFRAKGPALEVDLTSTPATGTPSTRKAKFKPVGGKVLIVIGNTMHHDTGPVYTPSMEKKDEHYSIYHQFIAGNTKGLGRIPHPTGRKCEDASGLFDATLQPTPNGEPISASTTGGHEHATDTAGNRAPSGLNCTPNTWP